MLDYLHSYDFSVVNPAQTKGMNSFPTRFLGKNFVPNAGQQLKLN